MRISSKTRTFLASTRAEAVCGDARTEVRTDLYRCRAPVNLVWPIQVEAPGNYYVAIAYSSAIASAPYQLLLDGSVVGEDALVQTSGYFPEEAPSRNYELFDHPSPIALTPGEHRLSIGIEAGGDPAPVSFCDLRLTPEAALEAIREEEAKAAESRGDLTWFQNSSYGVKFSWTSQTQPRSGARRPYPRAVADFDVEDFADTVGETGAAYAIFTANHAEPSFPAPLGFWESLFPGWTTERDLVDDMIRALGSRGIRLFLYLNPFIAYTVSGRLHNLDGSRAYERHLQIHPDCLGDYLDTTCRLFEEIGERYGEGLAGYWIDSWHQVFNQFGSIPMEPVFRAAKTGNANRLTCFNWGIRPAGTPWQEYWSAEVVSPGVLPPVDRTNGRMLSGPGKGLNGHALLVMDDFWWHRDANTDIVDPRLSSEELIGFIKDSIEGTFAPQGTPMETNATVTMAGAAILLALACTHSREVAAMEKTTEATQQPLRKRDYSFGWWPSGFRKEKGDTSASVFCVESGRYGFTLDAADFSNARLGRLDGPGYLSASTTGSDLLAGLSPAQFKIEIEHEGKTYRAVSCLAGRERNARESILLESGRFAQRYRFPRLEFKDDAGEILETDSALELVAWPSSLTFSVKAAPDFPYESGPCPGVVGVGRAIRGKPIDVPHGPELDPQVFTLEAWVRIPKRLSVLNSRHWLIGKNANEWEEGNFGLMLHRDTVTAIMNIGGGRENVYRVDRRRALRPGGWHHLAMSYDNDTLRFYVNGRRPITAKVGKVRTPGTGKLRIGGRPDGHGKPVHALFDEIRIWDRALSGSAIRAHAKNPDKFGRSGLSWRMSFDEDAKEEQAFAAPDLDGAKVRVSLNDWAVNEQIAGNWRFGVTKEFVLHCPIGDEAWRNAAIKFAASDGKELTYKTQYETKTGAYVVDVPKFDRDWKTGYTDIRNYDEVMLRIDNSSPDRHHVPVLFDVKRPAAITGQTPLLCDAEGRPTGIPIQLSKNWHHGAYSKFYAILPVAPGRTEYRLRITYGFWGKLPAASHAQLSLYGYGGNGRWDQLAIGCWGETICFDMDNSLTPMMVTDVRMLMTRKGKDGRKWSWSDGGWGGDWLGVSRAADSKLHPVELKTAYLAQGPCLTDVRYSGFYGKERDVAFEARVATLRTDDHNRVFQQLRYRFIKQLGVHGSHLFKMGPNNNLLTPRIAYGNRDGLIAEHTVPGNLGAKSVFREQIVLTGQGPWWVAFPGSFFSRAKDWGTGSRGLIIRSFKAVYGGKAYGNPVVSFPAQLLDKARKLAGLNLELVVPKGISQFMPGDMIDMDLEWITVPRVADDYYGPNKAFLAHLQQNPKSWKTVYREAIGNNLEVNVAGGKLLHGYPIIVAASGPQVEVTIKGGVGVVPIRFEGLRSANGYALYRLQGGRRIPLDQSVHGNDFWQTDYDAESGTYNMSFNLVFDAGGETTWVLAK